MFFMKQLYFVLVVLGFWLLSVSASMAQQLYDDGPIIEQRDGPSVLFVPEGRSWGCQVVTYMCGYPHSLGCG
jgi:hypothetical protein